MWYCNPDFKGKGIIPKAFERLDDLVLGRKKTALQGILCEAFKGQTQFSEKEVTEFVTSLETEEELADWCWRLLKENFRGEKATNVLELIARHTCD